jgi:hypothetical protein
VEWREELTQTNAKYDTHDTTTITYSVPGAVLDVRLFFQVSVEMERVGGTGVKPDSFKEKYGGGPHGLGNIM